MSGPWVVSDGNIVRTFLSTDHVAFSDPDSGFNLLCYWCADMSYGRSVSELPPVHVGELLFSDTPDPRSWLCSSCEANVLTYL